MQQLAKALSLYQEITVYEAAQLYGKIGKFRFLQFSDDAVQGAIDLKDPKRIVLEYPRAIIHLMECNYTSFERAFIIEYGIGKLSARGSIILNLMGNVKNNTLINAIYTTLRETYSYSTAFALPSKDASDIRTKRKARRLRPLHQPEFSNSSLG
ncbi:hypothetical protein ACP8HI_11270 [Paenibacillus sp. FA6]|uniref:hypothetical protein n=1 Tax=Paenibacillus sp. FA6 TaxID=3413029 RepID=UPI003F6577E5